VKKGKLTAFRQRLIDFRNIERRRKSRVITVSLFAMWASCGLVVHAAAERPAQDASYTQFGNFFFKVPNGWNPVQKEDAILLVAPAPRPGTATFIALAVNDLDGDLQKSFNELWTGFQSSYRILQGGRISTMRSSKGYDAEYTTTLASDKTGKQWNVYLMGAQYGKHLETIMFLSDLPSGATYNAYLAVFQTFLADLSFGDALPGSKIPAADGVQPDQETPQPLPAGMLEGVYVCTGGADGKPTNKQFIFYPDGLMVYGLPQEGMIGFDFAHYRPDSNPTKNWVGRYKMNGDEIDIVWQNQFGDPARPVRIKRNETVAHPAWDPGWDTFIPMCRCTGKRFGGKYIWGPPATDQYLQFFPDGTFIDHRVTDQLIVPSPFYEHPRIQRGTYSIQSQTMILSFADGHRGMRTFVAPKAQQDDPMFEWIGLGWQQLYEENYAMKLAAKP
jgi:hypothetical protein